MMRLGFRRVLFISLCFVSVVLAQKSSDKRIVPPVLPKIIVPESVKSGDNDKSIGGLVSIPGFDYPNNQGCAGDYGADSPCDRRNGWWPLSKRLTNQMANELTERAGENPEIEAQFKNDLESPLTIANARVTIRNQQENRVIQLSVELFNKTNEVICAVGLYYMAAELKPYYAPAPIRMRIEAHSSYRLFKNQEDMYSYWIGNPDRLVVKVAGVEFENGKRWGDSLLGRSKRVGQ